MGKIELWECSPQLRWQTRYVPVPEGTSGAVGLMGSYVRRAFLQQLFSERFTGKTEWRDVPEADE